MENAKIFLENIPETFMQSRMLNLEIFNFDINEFLPHLKRDDFFIKIDKFKCRGLPKLENYYEKEFSIFLKTCR